MADRRDAPTATLFGAFAWVPAGAEPLSFAGDRPVALLTYLLLHRDAPLARTRVAALLWPDSTEGQARTNLRHLLFTLRRTLPDADRYLAGDATTLRWRGDAPLDLDLDAFDAALAAAATADDADARARHLEAAVARYRGDLLEGRYDLWLDAPRDAYRARWRDALRDLADAHVARGDATAARRASERRAASDPLDEPAAIDLIARCAAMGDRAGARRAFDAHAAALRADLDAEPAPAVHAALTAALAAALATTPEPPIRPPRPLPTPGTPLVGRDAERTLIAARLADPGCRLLTLVGPGGIGKTRLALEVALDRAATEPASIAWVGLAAARTPDQAVAAIAEVLRVRLRGSPEAAAELARTLAQRQLLLVLDDVEHLADAAPMLSALLKGAPGLRLLVTSRHSLRVPEEWRFEVGALPVPDDDADLAGNDAVRLFMQVARRVAGPHRPTDADLPDVARVCRAVGGVPLAVELAASWTRLLTPAEVAAEVVRDLGVLAGTAGDDRHRSLRSVFDHSWGLLDATEQAALARLAVFEAGFTREAAARVAGADLTRLAALVDRSLVQRTAASRYQLHPLVRQFALERLNADPGEAAATAERHATFTLAWLAAQAPALTSARQPEALAAVAAEAAEIRSAWAWALAHGHAAAIDAAAFARFYAHELRGALLPAVRAFEAVADAWSDADGAAARRTAAVARIFGGFAAFRLGRLDDAEAWWAEADAALAADDPARRHLDRHVALLHWTRGTFGAGLERMEASRTGATGGSDAPALDPWIEVMAEVYLGMIAFDANDLDGALERLEVALPRARALGDPRLVANALLILGRARLLLGDPAAAEALLREVLESAQDPNSVAYGTLYLGVALSAQGDHAAARAQLERAAARFAAAQDTVGHERAALASGRLDLEEGDAVAARARFRAVLEAGDRRLATRDLLAVVVGAAALRARAGDEASARAWLDAVLRHPGLDVESRLRAEAMRARWPGPANAPTLAEVVAAVRLELAR